MPNLFTSEPVHTEAVQVGLRKAARAAFRSFCSYGLPLLIVALSAWTVVHPWGLTQTLLPRKQNLPVETCPVCCPRLYYLGVVQNGRPFEWQILNCAVLSSVGSTSVILTRDMHVQAKALDWKSVEDVQEAIQHSKHQEITFTLVRRVAPSTTWDKYKTSAVQPERGHCD